MKLFEILIITSLIYQCNTDDPECSGNFEGYKCHLGNIVLCNPNYRSFMGKGPGSTSYVVDKVIKCELGCAQDPEKGFYCLNRQNKCIPLNNNIITMASHYYGHMYNCSKIITNKWNTYYDYINIEHSVSFNNGELTIENTGRSSAIMLDIYNYSYNEYCNHKHKYLQCYNVFPNCDINTNRPYTNDCFLHCGEMNNYCINKLDRYSKVINCTRICNVHHPIKIFVNFSATVSPFGIIHYFMILALFILI